MASYTDRFAKHWTLTATQVDDITFTEGVERIEVLNRDASGGDPVYFTIDGSTPAAAADDTFVVLPQQSLTLPALSLTVKVVSAGTPDISVHGLPGG